jgi:COP9 signalosome complex subunit 12
LLAPFPTLETVFLPLASAIKRASLSDFEAALQAGETYFVKRRIYLTLERARDIVLRNLFRKVFLAGGYEPLKSDQTEADRIRRTRVPISEFLAGARLSSSRDGRATPSVTDKDEVECLLANMIYKVSLAIHLTWRACAFCKELGLVA